ncbi:MAG: GHMP kinase [Lentisphaerae bacterium]|nr:GHMP kinase [Lentisphaerota bacterium]
MIIRTQAYPRAGLVGNPSDGYYGKTIALAFTNFAADVTLYESPELEVLPNRRDHSRFGSIRELTSDVRQFGYYGGIRLLKAAIKRFCDYCDAQGHPLHDRNFTIRYASNIPHLVGLAGSSAIITACFRALQAFYDVRIPKPTLANLVLSVETEELGISAGLQDRVAQVYQGVVYMDFSEALIRQQGYGRYEPLDPALLPPLYIAYRTDLAEGSEIYHNDMRERHRRGDPEVLAAIAFWISLTDRVRGALLAGRRDEIGPLLDSNFDRRRQVSRISDGNLRLVESARRVGASAKFTGSGGAIVGTYRDEAMFEALCQSFQPLGIEVFKPKLAPPVNDDFPCS